MHSWVPLLNDAHLLNACTQFVAGGVRKSRPRPSGGRTDGRTDGRKRKRSFRHRPSPKRALLPPSQLTSYSGSDRPFGRQADKPL